MLDGMSTDAFINGRRCFIAISVVRDIRCDQRSNFAGAKNELHEALKEVDANRLTTFQHECSACKPCWRGMGETDTNGEKSSSVYSFILFRQAGQCLSADVLL